MAKIMKKTDKRVVQRKPISWTKFFIILSVLLLLASLGAWWQLVRNNPRRTFEAMINNNFQTSSVTRTVRQLSGTQNLEQITHLQNQTNHIAISRSTLEQAGDVNAKVLTESIGTPGADYVRYVSITTSQKTAEGKDLNFGNVLNKWGKTEIKSDQSIGELYSDITLGIVPFADLSQQQRAKLTKLINDKKVYEVDYSNVQKFTEGGRPMYGYSVSVKPGAYIQLLKAFAEETGLTQLRGLDPSNYKDAASLSFRLEVDVLSQRLVKLLAPSGERTEIYSGYGQIQSIAIPTDSIPVEDLQRRLQSIR